MNTFRAKPRQADPVTQKGRRGGEIERRRAVHTQTLPLTSGMSQEGKQRGGVGGPKRQRVEGMLQTTEGTGSAPIPRGSEPLIGKGAKFLSCKKRKKALEGLACSGTQPGAQWRQGRRKTGGRRRIITTGEGRFLVLFSPAPGSRRRQTRTRVHPAKEKTNKGEKRRGWAGARIYLNRGACFPTEALTVRVPEIVFTS